MPRHNRKNVQLLGIAFLLIFFGFDGFQQYVTTYFQYLGIPRVGFLSLVLVYLAFMVGSLPAASVITRLGAKRSMVIAVTAYALYGFSLLTASPLAILAASVVLGVAASVLWTAQSAYLIRASDPSTYGADAGRFATMFAVGAASGVLLLGILLPRIGFRAGLAAFAAVPLLALVLLTRLDDLRGNVRRRNWNAAFRLLRSAAALRIAMVWFPFNFIQGFVLGIIPLKIGAVFGTIPAIGVLIALFYLAPVLTAYAIGAYSDLIGRNGMVTTTFGLSIAGLALLAIANTPTLLILAIAILAVNFGLGRTITFALVGDISNEATLDPISALTWFVQSIALASAFVLPLIIRDAALFVTAAAGVGVAYAFYHPIRRTPYPELRLRIKNEFET
ncbi:MFS transporter [Candidatus Uhrbacteria bacterium]|nr:MFS transporter [Candidatus Uhrbacteria bacterium]